MKRIVIGMVLAMVVALGLGMLAGCSEGGESGGAGGSTGEQYADQAFLKDMAKGLEARWDLTDKEDVTSPDYDEKQSYANAVDVELSRIEKYTDQKFEDTKLQELAIKYINALKDQKSALEYFTADYLKYNELWGEAYNERAKLMIQINDEYGLKISSKYENTWQEFIDTAKVANEKDKLDAQIKEALDAGEFKKVENYGSYDCSLTVENTTDVDFKSLEVQISFIDSDGVVIDTTSDWVENWKKGSKVKFSFYAMESFDKYEITPGYYEQA